MKIMKGMPGGFENSKGGKEVLARHNQPVMTSIFALGLTFKTAEDPETIPGSYWSCVWDLQSANRLILCTVEGNELPRHKWFAESGAGNLSEEGNWIYTNRIPG